MEEIKEIYDELIMNYEQLLKLASTLDDEGVVAFWNQRIQYLKMKRKMLDE